MPSWLVLALLVAGAVALVALQAAACTARWRTLWVAARQFSAYLLVLLVPAVVAAVWLFIWTPIPR